MMSRFLLPCLLVLLFTVPATLFAEETKPLTVEQLAERVKKSVVVVTLIGRDGKQLGLGSGFVIDAGGLIATNNHVIGEARPISVKFPDGKSYEVTEIHATEPKHDLAILKIDAKNLPALPLGDSNTLKDGQPVVAIGNPLGLQHSVVSGVVSSQRIMDGTPMLQLAIPIEKGNSGGPLLDMHGNVHGLLTLKSLVTRNLGFAVSINTLKPLIEKPNPIPMSRWLTIGALDPKEWTTLNSARWTQRAGRIHVSGEGTGFGGRALCLAERKLPEQPFEVAVWVKLDDEEGAAGLVFHSNGEHKHYGFYPSNGALRFSRFDGADVFSWNVLNQTRTKHYRPGEWNHLKVRVETNRIQCFVNDHLIVESKDSQYIDGKIGLAKFRDTTAEFKGFQVAKTIDSIRVPQEIIDRIAKRVADLPADEPPAAKVVESFVPDSQFAPQALRERAKQLEAQAEQMRQLAAAVHEQSIRRQMRELLKPDEEKINLLHAALLIAKLDNEELDVAGYLQEVERMAGDIQEKFKKETSVEQKLAALNQYLFKELGFHGSRTNYGSASNSYLNEVIDDREGLPITLSVLYMDLGRRLGLNIVGVGLPGHFVVRHEPTKAEQKANPKLKPQLIDPFDRGATMTLKQAKEKVAEFSDGPFDEQYLAAQTKNQILLRMVNNLLNVARNKQDAEAMLRYVEMLVELDPGSGRQRFFRAIVRTQTNRLKDAKVDLDWVMDHEPADVDLDQARQFRQYLTRLMEQTKE